jgi:hypothetical protein
MFASDFGGDNAQVFGRLEFVGDRQGNIIGSAIATPKPLRRLRQRAKLFFRHHLNHSFGLVSAWDARTSHAVNNNYAV